MPLWHLDTWRSCNDKERLLVVMAWYKLIGGLPKPIPYLEDHPRTSKWLITMGPLSPLRIGLFSLQMALFWLINGGDPNYLLNGMILQVLRPAISWEKKRGERVGPIILFNGFLEVNIFGGLEKKRKCHHKYDKIWSN